MENKAKFPPIVVFNDGKDNWLAHGFHRYYAAEKTGWTKIEAEVRPGSLSDAQWYSFGVNKTHGLRRSNDDKRKAVEAALTHEKGEKLSDRAIADHLNSEHGWQLTEEDKQSTAIALYSYGCTYDDIASTLSVGKKKVSEWLSRTVKEQKDKRDRKIREMWLACYTDQEIADEIKLERSSVTKITDDYVKSVLENQIHKAASSHATDFDVPLYNVWKQQEKTAGASHFGNSESRWVDNLLYLYTQPFDVVVDPFAGGGSTIDICCKRIACSRRLEALVGPQFHGCERCRLDTNQD